MTRLRFDRQLTIDFSWLLSGNVIYSACQWCIVLFLAKLGTPEQVGRYALGMALCAPIILFANLQVRTLLASDVREEFRFGQYLAFRLVSMGLALAVIGTVAAWSATDWPRRSVILLVGFAQVLEYVSDTYYGLMQKYDRMDRLSRSLMFKGPLALAALGATMYITRNVAWAVLSLALGRLFILLTWDSRLAYTKKTPHQLGARMEWNHADMLRLLRTALPLGFISMLAALSTNIPRYFIEAHLGTSDLGIYSAIASLIAAGALVVSAFGQSIMVPAAKACSDGNRSAFRMIVLQVVALGAVLGTGAVLVAALFGRDLLALVLRREYAEHADVFVWLMLAGAVGFVASGLGYVMTAARFLNPQIPLLVVNCLTTVGTSAWFIPEHGLRGAAEALLAASLVQLAGSAVILRRIDKGLTVAASSATVGELAGAQLR